MALIAPDAMNLSIKIVFFPWCLFFVNSWGSPYGAMMVGAKIVYPGSKMADGETLYSLTEQEGVTLALGVPTVWLALLQYADQNDKKLNSLQRTIIGGAAVPESMIRDFHSKHDVFVQQAWGMTEMSPLGTVISLKYGMENISHEDLVELQVKQGRGMFGVEMRIVNDEQEILPWDGEAFGALKSKGHGYVVTIISLMVPLVLIQMTVGLTQEMLRKLTHWVTCKLQIEPKMLLNLVESG